jgi:hypothetical protein
LLEDDCELDGEGEDGEEPAAADEEMLVPAGGGDDEEDGCVGRGVPLLGQFSLSLGMRMERLVVLRAMGGLSPSMSPVTTRCSSFESSTSHITVFRKLEDRASEASAEPWNWWSLGRSSRSSSSLVSLVRRFWRVRSMGTRR